MIIKIDLKVNWKRYRKNTGVRSTAVKVLILWLNPQHHMVPWTSCIAGSRPVYPVYSQGELGGPWHHRSGTAPHSLTPLADNYYSISTIVNLHWDPIMAKANGFSILEFSREVESIEDGDLYLYMKPHISSKINLICLKRFIIEIGSWYYGGWESFLYPICSGELGKRVLLTGFCRSEHL